jgi:hypothetical protein
MCNIKPLTPEELDKELKNPKFCACCEMICEENEVIDHCCKACRGD